MRAQDQQLIFDQITSDNGLSDNKVNDIVQDEDGFIWIATDNGLNRFDGAQFKKFFRGDKPGDLPGNLVARLMRMRGNYIAIGTGRGLAILNTRTNEFKRIPIPALTGMELFANDIQYISTDAQNELVVSTRTGIFVFNDQLRLVAKMEAGFTVEDAKTKSIGFAGRSLALNDDSVFIFTARGLICYDDKSKEIGFLSNSGQLFYRNTAKMLDDSVHEYSVGRAARNVLFIIPNYRSENTAFTIDFSAHTIRPVTSTINFKTEFGWQSTCSTLNDSTFLMNSVLNGYFVFHYSASGKTVLARNKKLIPQYSFRLIYADRENRLWGATTTGILKQSFSKELFRNTSFDQILKLNGILPEVKGFYSANKLLYVGLENEKTGLVVLDDQHRLLKKIDLRPFLGLGNYVWNLFRWYGDTIAISTQGGLLFYCMQNNKVLKPGSNFPAVVNSVPITNIFRDKQDNFWLGLGFGNGVLLCNKAGSTRQFIPGKTDTSFRLRYPNCIAQDTTGNIWFLRKGQGITRWNYRAQRFDTLITSFSKAHIDYFDFVCLDADREGNLWLGFYDYGLMKLNISSGETKMYNVKNGLAENYILNVFTGVPGQVWFIYTHGLGVLDTKTGKIKNFSKQNGLPDYIPASLEFYYDSTAKQMMIGFDNAFSTFDPFRLVGEKAKQKVYITEVDEPYDSLTLSADKNIALKYFQNNISINFSAIDYDNSADINYEYRLYKNENTPWINVLHQQTVNLNLSPGHYDFQVRVVGDTNSVATRQINISFPYYEKGWFYTICGIILMVGLYSLYRYRINQLMQVQTVRNRISADLHDDIGARLTNINLLSALSEQNLFDPQQAADYLKRIGDEVQTSGEALDDIVWSINTKNDSVEEITARMRRYAANVFDATNINYNISADENVLSVKLTMEKRRDLFLVYKEAINNIFKHALATEVRISIKVKGADVVMQISDNGKGFDTLKPTHRNGLKNIGYRMEKSGGSFTIRSAPGNGTTFLIKLPHSKPSLKRSILKRVLKK